MAVSGLYRLRPLTGVARELVLVSAVVIAAFIYLDVPIGNAVLFGVAVVMQAAFGTVVLLRLLSGVKGSLLLLLGPGLIVGGALSFAVFQIVGRGWFGVVMVVGVGVGSTISLIRSPSWEPLSTGRLWILGQLLGLAAFALTWEFPELLPVAVAFFVLGIFTGITLRFSLGVRWIVGGLAAAVVITPLLFRQDYWWLVTDDYQMFEVMSRHITKSGPFADWGEANWSRYHWLSYGWSGLLNLLGANPEAFVTLTRVMPFVYSISLAASLALLSQTLHSAPPLSFLSLLPTWVVIAFNRLDWSGTSTSGVYAVIIALIATVAFEITTTHSLQKRLIIYLTATPIIILTKLPSIFAAFLTVTLMEIWVLTTPLRAVWRRPVLALSPILLTLLTFFGLRLASSAVGQWALVRISPNLGQLAEFGPTFAFSGLLLKKLWVLLAIVFGIINVVTHRVSKSDAIRSSFAFVALPLLLGGLLADLTVFGSTNQAEYLSGPMYILSTVIVLTLLSTTKAIKSRRSFYISIVIIAVCLTAWGNLWERQELNLSFWIQLNRALFHWHDARLNLIQWLTQEGQFAIALVCGLLLLLGLWRANLSLHRALAMSVLISFTATTLNHFVATTQIEMRRERTQGEIATHFGSVETQVVAEWLKSNSKKSDLVATNSLLNSSGGFGNDFSLALLAERTFYVIAPRFFYGKSERKEFSTDLSMRFAINPDSRNCMEMAENNVKWFIVNLTLTENHDWSLCTTSEYSYGNFLVLKF